ncbi:MAG: creatininase family protein [Proteobacteria bacterium]|mgnify:CR=1 FL=1|nr:creatininase family protein [Pseudomonadota bacterium]
MSARWQIRAGLPATVAAMLLAALPGHAQVQPMGSLNVTQLAAVDKAKTVVIIPGGIMEEHGPFLPAYTDGYVSERQTQDVADALVAKGWRVLVFPAIPLGSGGANELAAKYPFPGTYVVRLNTLRAVYMDLADELGEAGFKWIFLIHSHGAPNHTRVLEQAGDYFASTWHGHMRLLGGLSAYGSPDNPRNSLSDQARKEDAFSGHGGIDETSLMLFLKPELVDPAYMNATAFPAMGDHGMIDVARQADWKGYFGAPRYSTAEYGAKLYRLSTDAMIREALDTLGSRTPAVTGGKRTRRAVDDAAIRRDSAIEKRQQEWLKGNDR